MGSGTVRGEPVTAAHRALAASGGRAAREPESGKGQNGHDLVRNAFTKWHEGPRSIYGGRMGPVTRVTVRR